ncbi:hypothetical protein FVE85_0646 [Porphyridium purpureum]|uniref:Uncharacterized protein n=1 Tax=Porphyridium purpureum TaxID=35688 RepID=A0A5J4Z2M5_PORPP|nr:hypothetical protein FVE85_0646 [Porphyridium purpureum]|eukprot:POR8164..scf208_2
MPTAPSLGHSQSPPGSGLQEKPKEIDHDPLQELSADDPALLLRVRADSLNKAWKPDRQVKVENTMQREPLIQATHRQNEHELNDREDDRFSLPEEDIVFDEDPSKASRMSWSSSSGGSSISTSRSRSSKGTKQGMNTSGASEHEDALSVSLSGLGSMSDGTGLTQSSGSVFVYGQSRAASNEGDNEQSSEVSA